MSGVPKSRPSLGILLESITSSRSGPGPYTRPPSWVSSQLLNTVVNIGFWTCNILPNIREYRPKEMIREEKKICGPSTNLLVTVHRNVFDRYLTTVLTTLVKLLLKMSRKMGKKLKEPGKTLSERSRWGFPRLLEFFPHSP